MWWLSLLSLFGLVRRYGSAVAAVALGAAASAAALADEPPGRDLDQAQGWIAGANGALVRGSVDAHDMDARLARQGYETETSLTGQERFGYMLFGGYRWQHVGLEAAYVDLGEMTTRVAGRTAVSDEYLLAISRSHPQSGAGPQFSALGFLPLGERLEARVRIGTFYWRSNMSAEGASRYRDTHDRAFDPVIGVGANLRANARWSVSAEWLGYRLAGERIDALTLGAIYRFGGAER